MDRLTTNREKGAYYMPSWWRLARNESVSCSLPQASSDMKSRTLGRSACSKLDEELFLETEKALTRTLRSSKEGNHDSDKSSHSRKNHTVKLERFLASMMEANADSRNPCMASVRSNGIRDSKEHLFSNRANGRLSALQNSLPGPNNQPASPAYLYSEPALGTKVYPFLAGGRSGSNKSNQASGSRSSGERSLRLAPTSSMVEVNNHCHLSHTFRGGIKAKDASSVGSFG